MDTPGATTRTMVPVIFGLNLPRRAYGNRSNLVMIQGKSFFSLTHRLPAEVLVVEGWIGKDGIRAAAAEFERGGYQYIETTVSEGENRQDHSSNYAEMAKEELIRLGVPKDRIIIAPTGLGEHQRTFRSAVAAWRALQKRGIRSEAINLLTLGNHARRSHLVYAKVYGPATRVGVIAWAPLTTKPSRGGDSAGGPNVS